MFKNIVLPLALSAGFAVYFANSSPQTAQNIQAEMEKRGYKSVSVQASVGHCDRWSRKFPFKAVSPNEEPARGFVCGNSIPAWDAVRIQN